MTATSFDEAFFSGAWIRDPVEPLSLLQKQGSVHFSEQMNAWVVLGWEDARAVLKSRAIGQGDRLSGYTMNLPPEDRTRIHPVSDYMDRAISFLDPPDHTPERAAAAQVLDAGLGRRIEPALRETLQQRLEDLSTLDNFDATEDFALPITVAMISSILGIRYEDRGHFVDWVERVFAYIGSPMNDPMLAEDCRDAYRSIGDYVATLFAKARAASDPEPSTLIGMFATRGEQYGLTERDFMGMTVGMVQGGFETTTTLISNTVAMLLGDSEQRERVTSDPSLIPGAIEEVLRLAPSLKIDQRQARADVELSDATVKEGDTVVAILLAANRDPAVFVNPHSFDITRSPNPHLSFGFGTHFCLGAPLARMQARMAIKGLFARFPNMRLATDGLVWRPSALLRRREAVPVLTHG
jgi:cytochrome P450